MAIGSLAARPARPPPSPSSVTCAADPHPPCLTHQPTRQTAAQRPPRTLVQWAPNLADVSKSLPAFKRSSGHMTAPGYLLCSRRARQPGGNERSVLASCFAIGAGTPTNLSKRLARCPVQSTAGRVPSATRNGRQDGPHRCRRAERLCERVACGAARRRGRARHQAAARARLGRRRSLAGGSFLPPFSPISIPLMSSSLEARSA